MVVRIVVGMPLPEAAIASGSRSFLALPDIRADEPPLKDVMSRRDAGRAGSIR
jgi:hypothetical protein